ncbi:sigma-70 family RNA polymerase sigma factor [Singulisphaera sp. Ch08]|uniref:Sigma-70 family RNA polymerase sigma factor n=1 Tax=Singulisphaera sp. Ch08 TaxID=3120278 RepID=A0AAU7C7Z4_9BACT
MATRKDKTLRPQFSTLFNIGAIRERTDGQLLERFATDRGELAELAFAALVERHGSMVMRVCRAQLSNSHDAQDAFQATFLILVKKARRLWVQDSLGPWLHQVALRTAQCARADAARRRRLERQAAEVTADSGRQEKGIESELAQRLHEEIDRLPERFRLPIVLCDLEGHTCEEAARRMGRPVGTVKSWRSRGRERLRRRLNPGGLIPSITLEATLATDVARGAIPKPEAATVRAAAQIRLDRTTPGEVSASVWMLVKGVMKTMLLSKLRTVAAFVSALALFAAGVGTIAGVAADDSNRSLDEPPNKASRLKEPSDETWNLTLREAIHIGLDHSEVIHVRNRASGGDTDDGYEIAPRNVGQDVYRFKAETMAHIRSIEQQYWSLAQQHVHLRNSEKAVELAEEIKKREESELKVGRGTVADVAEATQRLEQFRLDLVSKTSDVITTERQLRNILGLPKADGRRIVPVSQLREDKVSPDWNTCLANLLEKQPDVAHAIAELEVPKDPGAAVSLSPTIDSLIQALRGQGGPVPSPAVIEARLGTLMEGNPSLQQVIQQTMYSLGRFVLEIDANHKQYQLASKIRTNAAQRLKVQRAFYEEGRITLDRYLDSVSQYATAEAQEALFKSSYNISLIALEEAQGTLLEHKQITIVDGPRGSESRSVKRNKAAKPNADEFQSMVPTTPTTQQPPPEAGVSPAKTEIAKTDLAGKEFSFEMTIPIGPKPITIRGSFSVTPTPSTETSKTR